MANNLWYISFATDEGFRGATVVAADDERGAIAETDRLGINPGGEALIIAVPKNLSPEEVAVMISYKDRLVTKEEVVANGAKRLGDLPEQARDRASLLVVCQDCNTHGR